MMMAPIAASKRRYSKPQMASPNYHRTAFLLDASGQSDGTGYTPEESRQAWALTYTGGAAILSNKFEFDGVNDVITTLHSLLWTFGSKFTLGVMGLEFDVTNTGTNQGIVCQYNGSSGGIGWTIYEGAGNLVFSWSTNGTGTTNSFIICPAYVGVSYDVFVCWDGVNIYTMVNGVPRASTPWTANFADADSGIRFGALATSGSSAQWLNGRFTACFLTRGECLFPNDGLEYASPSLPLAMATPTLTDPEWANVIALIGYDAALNKIRDYGPYDWRLNINNQAAGTLAQTLADGTPSIAFDGTNDSIFIVDDPLVDPTGTTLTLECYSRHTVINTNQDLITKYNATSSQRCCILNLAGATNTLNGNLSTNGVALVSPSGAFTATSGVFQHKALCMDGTTARVFAAGAVIGSAAFSSALFNSNAAWLFGQRTGGGSDLNGHATEFRITKAARYTGAFTAPTGAFPRG